ncbi:hypothetical protein AAEO50_19145 [Rossellomorea oryzaecorticis]|uniref:Uncharacterized protein n=1 Tax=Rossellomorea oryzaecorticis TaxID=1396505 RepID=A0ABU9KE73_9BACI
MRIKKWIPITILPLACLIGITVYWFCHYPIIEDDYTELSISKDGQIVYVIDDQDLIRKIIDKVNTSPRSYHPQNGFRYDYLPHGVLIFKNGAEKRELAFVMPMGNVVTKYWEIETSFDFGEDPDDRVKQKMLGPGF